jgi:ankyrin repeat protein
LWIACRVDSKCIVRKIFSLHKAVRDEQSPDGTTAFSIALANDSKDIVEMFLHHNVGQSRSLYAAGIKTKKSVSKKHKSPADKR